VESFVVRIYRRHAGESNRVVGVVEHPERGTVVQFNGAGELMEILTTPLHSTETAVAPEAKRNRVSTGEEKPEE
jgi:hypothetical protein